MDLYQKLLVMIEIFKIEPPITVKVGKNNVDVSSLRRDIDRTGVQPPAYMLITLRQGSEFGANSYGVLHVEKTVFEAVLNDANSSPNYKVTINKTPLR